MNDSEKSYDATNSYDRYLSSFSEWFADNVSKYVSSSEKPKTSLEKFFYDIYKSLKKVYDSFKKKNKLFPEFEKWLDSVFDTKEAEGVLLKVEEGYTGDVSRDKDVSLEKDSSKKSGKGSTRGDTFNKAKEAYKKARESGLDTKESISESFKIISIDS